MLVDAHALLAPKEVPTVGSCLPRPIAIMLVVALVSGACADESTSPTDGASCAALIDAPASVTNLTPQRVYGALLGENTDQAEFGFIIDVEASRSGGWYVADPMAGVVYDIRDGETDLAIGTRGEGPGEFLVPLALWESPAGGVVVFDSRTWRVSEFDSTSALVSSYQVTPLPQEGPPPEAVFSANGTLLMLSYEGWANSLEESLGGRRTGRVSGHVQVVKWNPTNEEWDRIVSLPGPEVYLREGGLSRVVFGQVPVWTPSGNDTLFIGRSGDPIVKAVSLSTGEELCRLDTELAVERVSDRIRTAYVTGADRPDLSRDERASLRASRDAEPMAEQIPLFGKLLAGPGGTLIATRYRPDVEETEVLDVLALDLSTGQRTNVTLPRSFRALRVEGNRVVGVLRDSLDVQRVAEFMLNGG